MSGCRDYLSSSLAIGQAILRTGIVVLFYDNDISQYRVRTFLVYPVYLICFPDQQLGEVGESGGGPRQILVH
jgi:hypothetical protein